MTKLDTVSIIGLGYIGLPIAAMFSSRGVNVIGVDINPDIVASVNTGNAHFIEPGLSELVLESVRVGLLRARTTPEPADAFVIAVPTPFDYVKRTPIVDYVLEAVRTLSPVLRGGNLVVLESTCPVGTTDKISTLMAEMRPDLKFPHMYGEAADINIAYCPERILPGNAMKELLTNSRLIGGLSIKSGLAAKKLYELFVEADCVVASGPKVAEMAKLAENTFRDVNIALANELSMVCDDLDVDVWELISLANLHPRVDILQPGPGVGGHCIAVDPWFLAVSAPKVSKLIKAAREVNDSKPLWVVEQVERACKAWLHDNPSKTLSDIRMAIYGLTFKPNVDDLRESPSLEIARTLVARHPGPVLIIEPFVDSLPNGLEKARLSNVLQVKADVTVLLVDHLEFKSLAPPSGFLVDTRGMWNAQRVEQL